MRNNRFIRSFFGIILLAAFALSNTPTRVLHRLFANHLDSISHSELSKTPQLNVAGIDCHCQSNVVVSPYTFQSSEKAFVLLPVFQPIETPKIISIAFTDVLTIGLRGPPVL